MINTLHSFPLIFKTALLTAAKNGHNLFEAVPVKKGSLFLILFGFGHVS